MSRTTKAISGSATFMIQVALGFVTPLVVSPLLVKLEGSETLGAYAVIMQLHSYLLLLDLGMAQALIRSIAQLGGVLEKSKKYDQIVITGVAFLLITGVMVGFLTYGLAKSVPFWLDANKAVVESSTLSLIILAAWMPLRFPLSIFQLLLFAKQEISRFALSTILGSLVKAVLTLLLVFLGFGLPGLIMGTITSEIVSLFLCMYWAREYVVSLNWRNHPSWLVFRELLQVGFPLSVMSLGDRLTFYSQNVLIGAMFNAQTTAAFYATRTPGFLGASMLWRLSDSIIPGINELYGKNPKKLSLKVVYLRIAGYALGASIWATATLWAFNRPVVALWLGESLYLSDLMTIAVGLLIPISVFKNISTKFIVVEGRVKNYMWVVLLEGVIGLILALALGQVWGATGVMWATIFAHIISTYYLIQKITSFLSFSRSELLVHLGVKSLQCGGIGVLSCALYGLAVHFNFNAGSAWFASLVMTIILGGVGFWQLGILASDKAVILGMIRKLVDR